MVNVISTHVVKPAVSTPNETMHLCECDQVKPLTHAPTIYFFRPDTQISLHNAIHILKESLSKALVAFYPIAGRLHSIGNGRVEINCNSMGVLLLEAESELKLEDLGDFRPSPQVRALLPSVDFSSTPIEEAPLLLLQLTRFACGGLSLGQKLSHIVADGQSALHFVSEWAKLARGGDSINLPFLDRTVLQPKELLAALPRPKYSQLDPPPLLIGHSDNSEERKKATTVTMLKLSKEQIEKLKAKANQHGEVEKAKVSRPFSRFEALSAHVWRCASMARRHRSEQETICYVSLDFRNRLQPPLPPKYFGNAVMLVPAVATAGELFSEPLGNASGKIREAIESVTDEYVSSYLASIKNLSDVSPHRHFHTVGCSRGAFFGNPNLAITSWIGLPLYGTDFGWGKEIFMGPAALGYDGKSFFIPSLDGDGSISMPMCFQVEHLDAFEKHFYQEI